MASQSRFSLYVLAFGLAILMAGSLGWYMAKRSSVPLHRMENDGFRETLVVHKQEVHLYFGNSQSRFLSAERWIIELPDDNTAAARRIVEALIQGPKRNGTRTLPSNTNLRNLFISNEGIAYVDLASDAFNYFPGGIEAELLGIYSIVNTLVLNVEKIQYVKFLVGGQEAATLAGHVDLSRPFKADMLWVR